eukprot:scaffold3368_cov83-Alexandrium_tamarense.AAC.1
MVATFVRMKPRNCHVVEQVSTVLWEVLSLLLYLMATTLLAKTNIIIMANKPVKLEATALEE